MAQLTLLAETENAMKRNKPKPTAAGMDDVMALQQLAHIAPR